MSSNAPVKGSGFGHKLAAKLLKRLVDDRVLEIAEHSTIARATRYRYLGD